MQTPYEHPQQHEGIGQASPDTEHAVSCRTTVFMFEVLDEKGVDLARIMEGVCVPVETLRNPASRISWADFARLLDNASCYWKDDEIEQFGWRFLQSEWPQRRSALAALMTPADAYHFAIRDGKTRALSCIEHFAHEVDPGHLRITSVLQAGCEPSHGFFLLLKGMFTAIPALLGLAPARVAMEATALSACFDIRLPPARRLARLLRPLTYPLRARVRASDLRRAFWVIETSQQRYLEEKNTRQDAESALRQSEAQLRRAQQIAHVGSWEWTIGSQVTRWSEEHYVIFGVSPDAFTPTHERFLACIHPDDRDAFWNACLVALRGEGPIDMDFRVQCPDGAERVIHGRGEVTFDSAGQPLRMIGTSHDITERKKITEELDRYRKHLEQIVAQRTEELERSREGLQHAQRLASLGTLAAGVAHQINNPIGAILASAEYGLMLEGDDDRDDVWKEALATHALEAKRCGHIVRSLLQFARMEKTDRWVEDLNHVVQRSHRALESFARARSSWIMIDSSEHPMPVVMSPIELEQVFVNIIRNALESREAGVVVTIATRTDGSTLIARISDDGPGIDPDQLPRVFDPFFTGRLSEGGTGLGLSVAHGVIQDHGGTIGVESRPGAGSTFTVSLPCAADGLTGPGFGGDVPRA